MRRRSLRPSCERSGFRCSRATIAIADDPFVVTFVAFGGDLTACVHRSRLSVV